MKDDKGDFSKNIWNQSLQQGIKEGSEGFCKEIDLAAHLSPGKGLSDRRMKDDQGKPKWNVGLPQKNGRKEL